MRSSWRIAFWTTLALAALTLAAGAGAASARDGHGHDDGAGRAEARGHDAEQESPRREDRRRDDDHPGFGRPVLVATLAPSVPADPAVHAVAAGGLPWVLRAGSVRIGTTGRIRVELRGLVIPVEHGGLPAGTARPVTSVSASLYCAPESSTAAATTKQVPLSEGGNARIDDTITLPSTCLAPIVLVHPKGNAAAYIAATGWRA